MKKLAFIAASVLFFAACGDRGADTFGITEDAVKASSKAPLSDERRDEIVAIFHKEVASSVIRMCKETQEKMFYLLTQRNIDLYPQDSEAFENLLNDVGGLSKDSCRFFTETGKNFDYDAAELLYALNSEHEFAAQVLPLEKAYREKQKLISKGFVEIFTTLYGLETLSRAAGDTLSKTLKEDGLSDFLAIEMERELRTHLAPVSAELYKSFSRTVDAVGTARYSELKDSEEARLEPIFAKGVEQATATVQKYTRETEYQKALKTLEDKYGKINFNSQSRAFRERFFNLYDTGLPPSELEAARQKLIEDTGIKMLPRGKAALRNIKKAS